ncbi:MAG: SpaA isopeptide-forming pilin-related protein [Coriobacteriales bacterium]
MKSTSTRVVLAPIRASLALGVALVCALLALCMTAVPAQAQVTSDGHLQFDVQPNSGTPQSAGGSGVSDYTTDLSVSKLAADNHDYVQGAHLQILDASTREVVDGCDWWTSDTPQELMKLLDVDTDYVLHEEQAPDGFVKADDVTFTINAYDGEVVIKSGNDAGQAEALDKNSLALYDTRLSAGGGTQGQTGGGAQDSTSTGLPTTGDYIPAALVALAVVVAFAGAAALSARRNRNAAEKETE